MRKIGFTAAQISGRIRSRRLDSLPPSHPISRGEPRCVLQSEGQVWRDELSDAMRLRQLEDKNATHKRLLAAAMLECLVLKDLPGRP